MALAILNRGSGSSGGTNDLDIVPTSNFGANSLAVLFVIFDDDSTPSVVVSDSSLNQWENYIFRSVFDITYPFSVALYISKQVTNLTTSDNIDFTFGAGVNAHAFLYELTTSSDKRAAFIKDFNQHGSANLEIAPSLNGIATGDGIIAWAADTASVTYTGDTDTVDGSWSSIQTEDTSVLSVVAQSKILTGTSTQNFFPDTGTANILGWFAFKEHSLPDESKSGFFGL